MSEATREHVIDKSRQIIQSYVNRVKSFETQNDYLSIEGQSLINNYSNNIENQKQLFEEFLINDDFFENISDDQLILLMNKCRELNKLYELNVKDVSEISKIERSEISKLDYSEKIRRAIEYSSVIDEILEEIGDIKILVTQMVVVSGVMIALAATGYGAAVEALGFVLLTVGAAFSGTELLKGIIGLAKFFTTVTDVETEEDLKRCGKLFGDSVAKIGVDGFFFVLSMFGLKKSSTQLTTKKIVDNVLNSKKWAGKKIKRRKLDIEKKVSQEKIDFHKIFKSMSNEELFDIVQNNPRYDWIVKEYDLITRENIKDIVILRKDGSLNLDWPKYAGLKLESVKSIGNMKGKVYVSRSGSGGGNTLVYGDSIESWYASNSQRSIPSSNSKIRTGVMDVDKYKKVIEIINTNIDDDVKGLLLQKKMKISEDISDLLIRSYYEWNGKRFEVFGTDGIVDGLQSVNISIDSSYGFSGNISPWQIGGLNMEGGSGQLNTSFSWELLVNSSIIDNVGEVTIK